MNMIEVTETLTVENGELTPEQRTQLQKAYDFIAIKFHWLASRAIYALSAGALAMGIGGAGVVTAQEAGSAGVGGDKTEQTGVEVAQAFPRLGIVNGEVNVRITDSTNSSILQTLASESTFTIIGENADSTWYRVLLDNETEGWIFAELVVVVESPGLATPPELPVDVNATATAEAPAILTFQTANGETITATPAPEAMLSTLPQLPTPEARVYQTQASPPEFFARTPHDGQIPRYKLNTNNLWEDQHQGRQTVDAKNKNILTNFFAEYPDAIWSNDHMDYVVTVNGEERIWRSGEMVTVQDQIILEFPDGGTITITIEMNGDRMSQRSEGDRIAGVRSVFEEWEIEEIKMWITQNRPDLIGKHIVFTFVTSAQDLQPYLTNALDGESVLQFAMRADGVGRTSLRTIYFRGAESWFPGDKNARDFGVTYAFLFGLVTPGSSNWNGDLDKIKGILNMSFGSPIPMINTLFDTSNE